MNSHPMARAKGQQRSPSFWQLETEEIRDSQVCSHKELATHIKYFIQIQKKLKLSLLCFFLI